MYVEFNSLMWARPFVKPQFYFTNDHNQGRKGYGITFGFRKRQTGTQLVHISSLFPSRLKQAFNNLLENAGTCVCVCGSDAFVSGNSLSCYSVPIELSKILYIVQTWVYLKCNLLGFESKSSSWEEWERFTEVWRECWMGSKISL